MTSHPDRLPLGDIATSFLLPLERVLAEQGHNARHLLQRYGLTDTQLNLRDSRISIPRFMRIGHEAIRMTRNPQLGLQMGTHSRISDSGLAGLAALTAPTIGEAIQTITAFERLNSHNSRGHSRYYLEPSPEQSETREESRKQQAVFHFYSISPYNSYNHFVVDFMLASIASLAGWLSGQARLLKRVEIEYPRPVGAENFELHFGCAVEFSAPRNALIFKPGRQDSANQFANLASFQSMTQLCQEKRLALQMGQSMRQKVIELIGPELSSQNVEIGKIARKMGMASWSLRRRLQMEGYRFQDLLDETRREMARSYVRDTQHSFTEIAYLLGFSNPSGFQRAFQRWTGTSPGNFRRQHHSPSE